MINLLYHSHTVVPAHLEELSALEVLEPHEQVLAAIDGVLLDHLGQRISGPTLHDYCLITDARLVLWARDYAQHLCYAFPLQDLHSVNGQGVDPIHGLLSFTFHSDDGELQAYTLTLAAQAHIAPFVALVRTAATTAQRFSRPGADAESCALEVTTALGAQIYGRDDALLPGQTPYRWPGAEHREPAAAQAAFTHEPSQLPPTSIFTAGRFARSAWDTLRRSLRDTDLPFDLSAGSVREFTEAVRAVNDLVQSVVNNPGAQQLAMAFIQRRQGGEAVPAAAAPAVQRPVAEPAPTEELPAGEAVSSYREIPLRRRGQAPVAPQPPTEAAHRALPRAAAPAADRREIPLRRRTRPPGHAAALSGSGDAECESGP